MKSIMLATFLLFGLSAFAQSRPVKLMATPQISSTGQHSVDLKWTPPTSGGQAAGYNVKRGPVGGPYVTIGSPVAPVTTFTDASVAVQVENAKFGYVISATGPGGESLNSAESNPVTIPFSVPGTPGSPTATPH